MTKTTFTKMVRMCRLTNSKRYLEHAALDDRITAFKELFSLALEKNSPIRLVSGAFNPQTYDSLAADLTKILKCNIDVKCVVFEPRENLLNNQFHSTLESYNVPIRYLERDDNTHFMLIGDRSFRVEFNHASGEAVVCFNDPKFGEFLTEKFNRLFDIVSPGYPIKTRETAYPSV